ncbi:uncharacterized protein LOC143285064 [Babylonia areolata]|uniref:uncharacterized protein LOC143285064 n=1 Tax=Babylonia areolata TaxID=304850 RepID=UPI003FD47C6B
MKFPGQAMSMRGHGDTHTHTNGSVRSLEVEGGRRGRVGDLQNGDRSPREGSPVAVIQRIPRSPRLADRRGPKKLILHMDLRNTLLVADSVTQVSVEQALNAFLTGATWGREEEGGRWVWHSDVPSIKPPAAGTCTYYKFLERQLVRTPSERTALRLATGDFTSTPIGTPFLPHFQRLLQALRWQHGQEERGLLTMAGRDGRRYHYILEGVYRLVRHLLATQRRFALVIRTYGLDAPHALTSLAHGLSGQHPAMPQHPAPHLPVNPTPGRIDRPSADVILLEAFRPDSSCELLCQLSHERDIYRFLSASEGVSGFKDDFKYWQDHHYNHHTGKPLWIDPYDTQHHHIIFDDNFRALDEDSIVDVRVFSQEESTRAYSLGKTQLSVLEDVCLVQADLLQSIEDRDYFLRKVELCEANYSRMLKTNTFPS